MRTINNEISKGKLEEFEQCIKTSDAFAEFKERYMRYRMENGWKARAGNFKGVDGKPSQIKTEIAGFVIPIVERWSDEMLKTADKIADPEVLKVLSDATQARKAKWTHILNRKIRDLLEDEANERKKLDATDKNAGTTQKKLENPKEQVLPGFDDCEAAKNDQPNAASSAGIPVRQNESVKLQQDVISSAFEAVIEAIKTGLANIEKAIVCQNNILADALFVKEGDLKDRDTNRPKHVNWPWFHSIQSELAQIRGIMAPKKEKAQETAEASNQNNK